jgi:hypothetical protein
MVRGASTIAALMRARMVRRAGRRIVVIVVMAVIAARQRNGQEGECGNESKHLHGVNLLNPHEMQICCCAFTRNDKF